MAKKKQKQPSGWLNPHSRQGRVLYMTAYLLAAYVLLSVAIDSGNLVAWGAGFFFLGWAVNNAVRLLYKPHRGAQK